MERALLLPSPRPSRRAGCTVTPRRTGTGCGPPAGRHLARPAGGAARRARSASRGRRGRPPRGRRRPGRRSARRAAGRLAAVRTSPGGARAPRCCTPASAVPRRRRPRRRGHSAFAPGRRGSAGRGADRGAGPGPGRAGVGAVDGGGLRGLAAVRRAGAGLARRMGLAAEEAKALATLGFSLAYREDPRRGRRLFASRSRWRSGRRAAESPAPTAVWPICCPAR